MRNKRAYRIARQLKSAALFALGNRFVYLYGYICINCLGRTRRGLNEGVISAELNLSRARHWFSSNRRAVDGLSRGLCASSLFAELIESFNAPRGREQEKKATTKERKIQRGATLRFNAMKKVKKIVLASLWSTAGKKDRAKECSIHSANWSSIAAVPTITTGRERIL